MNYISYLFSTVTRLFISPDFLIVLFLFISFIVYERYRKLSRRLFALMLSLMIALTFLPIGEWLIYPLESRFDTNPKLPTDIDGVIMLSGGEEPLLSRVWGQIEFDKAVERNIYFFKFMRQYPDARFIFSGGGKAEYQGYSENLVRQFARSFALDDKKLEFELHSKNTLENVKNLYELIQPQTGGKWIVITSAWHMPRAKSLFDRYKWNVIPYPVDHLSYKGNLFRVNLNFSENLEIFKVAIKEWVGIIVYRNLGMSR